MKHKPQNLNKICLLLVFIVSSVVHADGLNSDSIVLTSGANQANLYKLDTQLPNKFAQKISMRRNFNNLPLENS